MDIISFPKKDEYKNNGSFKIENTIAYQFSNIVSIGTGIDFLKIENTYNDIGVKIHYSLHSFEIPIRFRFKVFEIESNSLFFETSFNFTNKISGDIYTYNSNNLEYLITNQYIVQNNKRMQLKFLYSYMMTKNIYSVFNIYIQTFPEIESRNYVDYNRNISFGIGLGLGYRFIK